MMNCFAQAKKEYQIALRKYRLAYDKILNKSTSPGINLVKEENRKILEEALLFWERKRLNSHAWCIMPNHFHWVLTVFEKETGVGLSESDKTGVGLSKSDNSGRGKSQSRESEFSNSDLGKSESQKFKASEKPVYLQDIMHSVKLYSARRINKNENRSGQLWEHESFETTIRNNQHFIRVVNYIINNPVSAGFVKRQSAWPGTKVFGDLHF